MTQLSPPAQEGDRSPKVPKSKRINPRLFIPLGLLIVGIGGVWYFLSHSKSLPDIGPFHFSNNTDIEVLKLSGRIEGYETNVGAKTAGRVVFVAVREGEQVQKNKVIAELSDAELQAKLQGATAQIAAAQQRSLQTNQGIPVLESQIRETQLGVQQSQGDARGRIFQAEANVAQSKAQLAQAEAQVKQAKAELKQAGKNRDRYATLSNQGAVNRQQFEQADTNYETALATLGARDAAVDAAKKQVNSAEGALQQARTTALNPNIKNAQIGMLREQIAQTQAQSKASQSDIANAIATKKQIEAQLGDLIVTSPIDGVVTARSVEPGVVVSAGKTLLSIIDPNTVYLRGYIPQGNIGKVRVGQKARVFLDSAPNKPLSAVVSAIDTQASFTPENIYFKDDRVKQVFGVKLSIDEPGGFAKPGMPADGEIILKPEASR